MFLYSYNCASILTNGPENHIFPLNVADGHMKIRTDGQLVSQTSFATKINIFRKWRNKDGNNWKSKAKQALETFNKSFSYSFESGG